MSVQGRSSEAGPPPENGRAWSLAPQFVLADRYEIVRQVDQGAMATVYLAKDLKHDREVAVKVLLPELADGLGLERFAREIGIAAHLTHPHILPLYDSGDVEGLLYFVMPFVRGASLRRHLRDRGKLPPDEALRLGRELASALQCAHRAGIVHRDVKPENVLLVDGHAVLTDFGIARAMEPLVGTALTSTGAAVGTPLYMSPEQLGAATEPDARSDVYSLACVVYEMLAGEPPFAARSGHALLAKRLRGPALHLPNVRPPIPAAVERALIRALDPEPAKRFPTAEAFGAALERDVSSNGSWVGSLASAVWRGKWRMKAAAGVATALVLAGAWMYFGAARAAGSQPMTLAVLPFTNVSGDVDQAYLADGLTKALIDDLGAVEGLRVTAQRSVMRYASAPPSSMASMGIADDMGGTRSTGAMGAMGSSAPPKSLVEIGQELGVNLVLQGSLRRVGDSVRVAATLLDPATQERLWTADDVSHMRDIFALQQSLAAGVARVALRGARRSKEPAPPQRIYLAEANAAYLKGAYFQANWRLPEAIDAFTQAVTLDSSHAPAQAGLARAYYFMAFFGDIAPGIALGAMRRAATAALEQDSLLAEAHGQLALVMMLQEWDWAGAEQQFLRALELNPSNAQIRHDYAHFLLATGRRSESLEQTRAALALDPANPMLISCLGWHSLFDRRDDEAIKYATEAHAMMPDQWEQVILGWALLDENRPDEALKAFREASRLSASAFNEAALGYALAVTGHTDEARDAVSELLTRAEDEYVSPYDIATVYAGLGDKDETFRWLRRAAEDRSTFFVHLAWDIRFDRVRDDERFRRLVNGDLGLGVPLTVSMATPAS